MGAGDLKTKEKGLMAVIKVKTSLYSVCSCGNAADYGLVHGHSLVADLCCVWIREI